MLISLGLALLVSCGKTSNNQSATTNQKDSAVKALQKLEAETMAIHDSIMPQMDSLMRLKNRLKRQSKKVQSKDAKKALKRQVKALDSAREYMMNWMSRFTKGYKRIPDSIALERKAAKLDTLHHDANELKKLWDQTLKESAELLKKESKSG